MKTFLRLTLANLMVLLLFVGARAQQPGIEFFHGSLAEAQQKAAQTNQLIFVDAYATWCGPCKWMAANTFTDPKVGKFFNENFISLKVDMERGEGPSLSGQWDIEAYPTLLFLNSEGEIVLKETGSRDPGGLIALAEKALGQQGPRSGMGEVDSEPAEMPDGMDEGTRSILSDLNDAFEAEDKEAFDAGLEQLLASDFEDKYFILIEAKVYWEEEYGDVQAYLPELVQFIEYEAPDDQRLRLVAAMYLFEYADTDEQVRTSRAWTESCFVELPFFYTYEFYAMILNRQGEKEAAIEAQEYAIALAKEAGEDTREMEEGLAEIKGQP